MLATNEGTVDRWLRVVVGLALMVVGFVFMGGLAGIVVGLVGLIPLVTGAFGYCPAYSLFGFSTCRTKPGAGPAA